MKSPHFVVQVCSVETKLLFKLQSSFDKPDHFFLICCGDYNEDNFNCWWQITVPVEDLSAAALPGEQLEKQSSILFLLKSLLSPIRKKKHFNAPSELVCNLIINLKKKCSYFENVKDLSLCCMWRMGESCTENKTPRGVTLWSSEASCCFDSFQRSDSHAAFVMAKYAELTDRTGLYPIPNRPSFLLPWPVVTFQH